MAWVCIFVGGVLGLFVPILASQHVAAAFVIFGVISLYIGFYSAERDRYVQAGKELTRCYHELHQLFRTVYSLPTGADASAYVGKFEEVRSHANSVGVSKQIFLSDWYAHYKFFWQMQIDWIQEARPFGFWRDKVPLSLYVAVVVLVSIALLVKFSI